jgi:predicted dehydrogenase
MWSYRLSGAFGGGAMSDEASHEIDPARLALGDPAHPNSIFA